MTEKESSIIIPNHKCDQFNKLHNLKLSVALEPVRILPITTTIWPDARLHIPLIKKLQIIN